MDFHEFLENPKHHAYLIFSDKPNIKDKDVHCFEFEEEIGVEIARDLSDLASLSSHEKTRKVLVSASGITVPAQHALLKTLEEVTSDTSFFFFFPKGTSIIPTLLSRFYVLKEISEELSLKEVEKFMSSNTKEKIEYIDEIFEKEGNEKHRNVNEFLNAFEFFIHKNIKKNLDKDQALRGIRAVNHVKEIQKTSGLTKSSMHILAFV